MSVDWKSLCEIICKNCEITIDKIDKLQTLVLHNNRLTNIPVEIGNLARLQIFDFFGNQLTELPIEIGNLTQLRNLNLSFNKLKNIPTEIGNLTQLQTLNLLANELKNIPTEIGNLTQLRALNLYGNKLTIVPTEICNLTQLQKLDLSVNQLTNIPIEIGNLTQLHTLYLYLNRLTNIPTEIGNLTQLQALNLCNNQLTNIPTEIGNLTQLQTLFVNNNRLTTILLGIIYLPNLRDFTYHNNETTNLHPAVTRWLNRLKTAQKVYSNNQSVHDHNIESTTNASIIKFVSGYKVNNSDVFDLVDSFSMDPKTKNLLKTYCNSDYVHSKLKLTFGEVALPVLDYINNHHNRQDLLGILNDEIIASEGKCFQGRLSRLINVLNGYHPDVHINISDNEQIVNIIIMLKRKYTDLNELISFFVTEMNERNYEQNVVDEWIMYIKENY